MAVQWDVLFFWSARRSGVLFRCFFAHEIESRQSDPSVTFDTFQALSGWLKLLVLKNMESMLVTLDTSQPASGWLKEIAVYPEKVNG